MEIVDGTYRARAKSWTLAETSTGKPEIAVEFTFSDADMGGRSITWHGYLSEKAFNRSIESLRICGWKGDDLTDLEGLDANEVDIVIENEEYEGSTFAKVRWVNRAGGLAVKSPMTGDQAKSFAASMRGKIRALDAAKGVKGPPAQANGKKSAARQRAEEPQPDDDIPF